jgi:SAM-dependent methyltransferase
MNHCPACDCPNLEPSYMGEGRFGKLEYAYRSCRVCETIFVDPMPDEETLAEMYSPAYAAQHYEAELLGDSRSAEANRELDLALESMVRECPRGRILDMGCGAGRLLRRATAAGLRIEGYEPVPASAERTARVTNVIVHSGRLRDIQDRYDLIHTSDVLEHTPRPLDVLLEMRELLAPGGKILARGPLEAQPTLFRHVVKWQRVVRQRLGKSGAVTMPPWHVILYTLRGWHALLQRAGLMTLEEHRDEFHWPAPERFAPRPIWVIKTASIALSRSRVGDSFGLCDRVVSLVAPV